MKRLMKLVGLISISAAILGMGVTGCGAPEEETIPDSVLLEMLSAEMEEAETRLEEAADIGLSVEDEFPADEVSSEDLSDLTVEVPEEEVHYTFRNDKLLEQHFEKHGIDMGFDSEEEYEEAACAVVNNDEALHKTEAEDGDDVYYLEETNEFVIVSTDGYIRTYFYPSSGLAYYNRQ